MFLPTVEVEGEGPTGRRGWEAEGSHTLCPPGQPLPFGSAPVSEPPLTSVPHFHAIHQGTSASSRAPPHARSLGWAGCLFCQCPPPPLHVHPGLLEPPLAANRVSEHPPAPGSREARPGPSPPPTAGSGPWAGDGHPRVAIPQCTVPQRERILGHQGCRASVRRRTPVTTLLPKRQGPGCPRGILSFFTFVSLEEPAV